MKLAVCIPFRTQVSAYAVNSWFPMFHRALLEVETIYWVTEQRSHSCVARTRILENALKLDIDWLLWLDDDAVTPQELVPDLLKHIGEADIIVPWFLRRDGRSMTWTGIDDTQPVAKGEGLRRIGKTGFHTVLMSRAAAQRVIEASEGSPFRWVATVGEESISDDVWFFHFADKAGLVVLQDCSITVGHVTEAVIK